jgi:N-acetylneuraminic acid mutarotase
LLQLIHSQLPGGWDDPVISLSGVGLGNPGEELLVNSGETGPFFDSQGQTWVGDFAFSGGSMGSSSDPVTGTTDEGLFQTHRTGSAFGYAMPVPDGNYEVTVGFVEPVFSASGQRLQTVRIEGMVVDVALDVFDLVGHDAALTKTYGTTVADGSLDLIVMAGVGQPLICTVEVRSLFPVLDLDPASHDFSGQSLGLPSVLNLTVENIGTDTLELSALTFLMNIGAGDGFVLDLDGNQYTGDPDFGPGHFVSVPATLSLPAGQSTAATLTFTPLVHGDFDLELTFHSNADDATLFILGAGGTGSSPFLHVVIEEFAEPVDYDGDGFEDVQLDGSLSHTHEAGHELTAYTWKEGLTTIASTVTVSVSFPLGDHDVCLTIDDDNLPADQLTACVSFAVSPVTAVPGVLAQYHSTGATPPETLLDGGLGLPTWTETLSTFTLGSGSSVGGSGLTTNVVVRLRGAIDVLFTDTYDFALVGGVDSRLEVDGLPWVGPLSLLAGTHAVEARFALASVGDLPLDVLFGSFGTTLTSIPVTIVDHDETLDPPIINAMTSNGSLLGGNTIVIDGFGFFPDGSVTVHWDAQDFTLNDFSSIHADSIVLVSPPHAIGTINVTVETPLGTSNVASFTYDSTTPTIQFDLTEVGSVQRPITGDWGPDGRFYVGMRFGQITAITFDDDYNIIGQDLYSGVSGLVNGEILGLTFSPFDDASPVTLYVAHCLTYAQNGDPPISPFPYYGQVSVLTGPNFDSPVPLVTGLPTSNHDHAINGMLFDNNGDLLIPVGSNTNAGVEHPGMGGLPESPLSAAILKARTSLPGFNGAVSYIETVSGTPNNDQMFGDIVDVAPGSDVVVHASGFRNPFELCLTTSGRLYAFDNGPNNGLGFGSTGLSSDDGVHANAADELMLVEQGRYYGHPNRNRGRADARQLVYYPPATLDIALTHAAPITQVSSSTNGIDEYRSTIFQGQLRGQLFGQRWNSYLGRHELSADGRELVVSSIVTPETNALCVRSGPGGALVICDFSLNKIKVLEPNDTSLMGMAALDIFPWRAPATGGTPFIIGGQGFGSLGDTSVSVGGVPATVTFVSSKRIEGSLPAAAVLSTELVDVVVDSAAQSSIVPDAFRWLYVPVGSEPGTWEQLASLPAPIGEVSAAEIEGVLYVIGEESADTYAYDIYAKSWSTVSARLFEGHHSSSEVVNGKWYLFGGILNGSSGQVQIYDPVLNSWSIGAPMPWNASSSATAVINGLVYIAGGMVNGLSTTNQAIIYDPVADSYAPMASMIDGRNHTAAGTDGSLFWVFGGRDGPNVVSNGFADVQIYDPLTDSWESSNDMGSLIAPLPVARGGMGKAVYRGGEFYVIGGETATGPGANPNDVYDRVDLYDPVANSWRTETPMATPRHGSFPVLFEGRILLPAGAEVAGHAQSDVLDVYDHQ